MHMSWTKALQYYGVQQPFKFDVAIPFILNCLGLTLLLVICTVLLSQGALSIGTPRFYFFFYISFCSPWRPHSADSLSFHLSSFPGAPSTSPSAWSATHSMLTEGVKPF